MKPTDIRLVEIEPHFPPAHCRTPLKFGAVVVDSLAFCHVRAVVETRDGRRGEGWGAMFLMDMWSWPSAVVEHDLRAQIMEDFVRALCKAAPEHGEPAHPIEIFHRLESRFGALAEDVSTPRGAAETMPYLAQLVAASPLDAAIHDAYGQALDRSVYELYGPEHMEHDLARYAGGKLAGRYPADFLQKEMPAAIPAFHLVGGLDKLRESELDDGDPTDGLPVSLDQWIRHEDLHCLKVKLKGTDLDWDVARIDEVVRIAHEEHTKRGLEGLWFTADTNEQCAHPDYIIEMIVRLKESNPRAERELLYVEQPTARDLHADRHDMREVAALKPVLIDESLMTLEDYDLAMELGWSGVALKACKCHSGALVFAALAEAGGIPYAVQDLTNPGIALIQSVSLAGHLRPLHGVETNSRQFFPAANVPEAKVHPGLYRLTDGCVDTSTITGPGFGFQWDRIERSFE
jgi:L-alanine-DL-glutamate epimerase-like enolase superfamily enzyme